MRIRTIGYFVREAFKSLGRNSWMGLASMGTVAVSLIIVGISLIIVVNANYLVTRLESNVEIIAFLKEDIDEQEARELKDEIKRIPGVADAAFVDKDQALREFRENLGDKGNIIDALGGENPLPHLYKVTTISPQDVDKVAEVLEQRSDMQKVDYGKGVVEKLFLITKWVRIIGLLVIVLLGLAAIFLIATTIRLTVFARRKEIQIMKVLGATNWFIRWPFLLEGMVLGFTGGLVAVVVVDASYIAVTDYIQREINLNIFGLKTDPQFLMILSAVLLGVGTLIGIVGSGISMRKFLRI